MTASQTPKFLLLRFEEVGMQWLRSGQEMSISHTHSLLKNKSYKLWSLAISHTKTMYFQEAPMGTFGGIFIGTNNVNIFNKCLSNKNQDRLENEGGACIMYTHFADGFCKNRKFKFQVF